MLGIKEIQEIIPHRHPFLLIDCIEELEPGKKSVGYKCITYNESQFLGHFPEEPVMPGVLMIEALAQTGAVAILSVPENKGKTAYFGAINSAKFKRKVVPGDKLELSCEIIRQKGRIGIGKAVASVDGEIAALGVAPDDELAVETARDVGQVARRRDLGGHGAAEGQVEVLLPAHEGGVRAPEVDVGQVLGEPEGPGGT